MKNKDYYRIMHYFFKRCITGFKPYVDFMPGEDECPKYVISDGYVTFVIPMDYMLLSDNILSPFTNLEDTISMLKKMEFDVPANVTEHYLRREKTYYHALRCGGKYVHVDDSYLKLFPKCDFYFRDGDKPIVLCTDWETQDVVGLIRPLADDTDGGE